MEREALEALFDRHGSDVFNFCLRVAGSREAAACATKAAFHALSLEPGPNPVAVARRESELNLLALARRESAKLIGDLREDRVPAGSRLPVQEANGRLAVHHREVLALRELAGSSYE